MKRIFAALLALVIFLSLAGCGKLGKAADTASGALKEVNEAAEAITGSAAEEKKEPEASAPEGSAGQAEQPAQQQEPEEEEPYRPEEGEEYYDLENVVLYLYYYGELPGNFITKNEAEALGWSGGSVQKYREGAAIGGDYFGNREGLLPKASGRRYTECDINTDGKSSRGAERLVFSNDGLYFYTGDHYESFQEVIVTASGEVAFK